MITPITAVVGTATGAGIASTVSSVTGYTAAFGASIVLNAVCAGRAFTPWHCGSARSANVARGAVFAVKSAGFQALRANLTAFYRPTLSVTHLTPRAMSRVIRRRSAPPASVNRIGELVDRFISSQDVKESSKGLYRRTLRQYLKWVAAKGYPLSAITREQVLEYKAELLSAGAAALTVASYITSVRRFYEWTEANKYYPNVAKGVKSPRRSQQFKKQALSAEQSAELIRYFAGQPPRDYAIINLLIRTGLRTIEAVRANVSDIAFKGGKRVLYVHGKGRDEKDAFVILTDKAYQPLAEYLQGRGRVKADEPLFIATANNNRGGRLTTRTVSKIAKEGLGAIGLSGRDFTAHSLRHTTAVNILRAGGKIEDAQGVLRHTTPATTQIYTATIKEELRLQTAAEELLDTLF